MSKMTFAAVAVLALASPSFRATPAHASGGSCPSDTMTLSNCTLSIKRRLDPVVGNRDGFRLICAVDACSALTSPNPAQENVSLELADKNGTVFNQTIMNPGTCVQHDGGYICKPARGTSPFRSIRLQRYPTATCQDVFVMRAQVRDVDLSALTCDQPPWGITFRVGVDCSDTSCPVDQCDPVQSCP
jgi:hypothetical protein